MDSLCRIVLADDHKLLMEGVRSLLAPYSELRVEGMAADGEEAVALAASGPLERGQKQQAREDWLM